MGATNFYDTFESTDYREGFRVLSAESRDEYGYDPYNGTISTTELSRLAPHRIAERYTKSADKKAHRYLEEVDYGEKWETRVLDLGVTGYEITTFKKVPHTSATVTYQTFYVAYADNGELGRYKTAAEARKRVERALASPDFSVSRYHVEKECRATNGGDSCSFAYEKETRRTKAKPKSVPKGAKVSAVHKWGYYGWASC